VKDELNTAKIFNIQSFSTTDGPGIRTVVFFQGCNMRCLWCHNPESIAMEPEVGFIEEKCIRCGNCTDVRDPRRCYAGALVETARTFTPQELWTLLKVDVPYFQNSEGGITFSGGESMLHVDFLEEIIAICRENGVHTAVDTAGHVPYEWLQQANPDLFLYDAKAVDPVVHKRLTGVDGELIWANLERLTKDNYEVNVRIPCVPGANWEEIPKIITRLRTLGLARPELLPYHSLGADKSKRYGKEIVLFTPPTQKEMNELKKLL